MLTAHEKPTFDEADVVLVNALQVAPRASWADLSSVLGVHATTLARRWSRLQGSGLARIAIAPGPALHRVVDIAFIELTCQNGAVPDVVEALELDQRVLTIQFIAGPAHLLLTVAAADNALAAFLLDTLGDLPGVLHYSVRTVSGYLLDSSRWSFRALPAAQARRLRSLASAEGSSDGAGTRDPVDRALMHRLSLDGRADYRELAEQVGLSPASVSRRLARMVGRGDIVFRCDIARSGTGSRFTAILWGSMAPGDLLALDSSLGSGLPELRMMMAVTGAHNVHLAVWLNSPADLLQVERRLLTAIPGLRLEDRRIVLRTFKYHGARIRPDGTFGEVVPMAY